MSGRLRLAGLLAVTMALASCAPDGVMSPPTSLPQLRDMESSRRVNYPRQTILLYNLRRVLDSDLNADARASSMKVVAAVAEDDTLVLEQLAGVLGNPRTPQPVRDEVLAFLLSKDYPELAQYVVRVLPNIRGSERLRGLLLEWLARHPTPAALSEVIKAWAEVPSTNQSAEADFRLVVARLTAKPWYEALLEALNAPGFTARGSAIEVLSQRVVPVTLKRDLAELSPRTEAVVVLQAFIGQFDCLPASGQELLSMAHIYRKYANMMDEASELSVRWRRLDGYHFNIRDYHLLNGLQSDTKRSAESRAELVAELSRNLLPRRHVRPNAVAEGQEDFSGRFDRLADRLTMADLWNLYLLDEMLSRANIQAAIAVMSDEDRADTRHGLGGLVFLEYGRAQAKLYPANPLAPPNDLAYTPSSRALADGRDALCRFSGHFETVRNADRGGPTKEELLDVHYGDYYLLVFTSLSEASFCAHYVNPDGVIVSLGELPLAR